MRRITYLPHMRSNPLLTLTAAAYGLAGLALTFAPAETLRGAGLTPEPAMTWFLQALGAALLALAWMNWLHRETKIGGIYGRTVLLPNLIFVSVAFWDALAAWRRAPERTLLLGIAIGLGVLSVAFGARLFGRNPQWKDDSPGR
ncbi:MAG: hypothetical protein R2862_07260 [Thermoanaerobaculia bacterium]